MKKQQLGEIKNIIDYAYKMEEFRKKNQEKMRKTNTIFSNLDIFRCKYTLDR